MLLLDDAWIRSLFQHYKFSFFFGNLNKKTNSLWINKLMCRRGWWGRAILSDAVTFSLYIARTKLGGRKCDRGSSRGGTRLYYRERRYPFLRAHCAAVMMVCASSRERETQQLPPGGGRVTSAVHIIDEEHHTAAAHIADIFMAIDQKHDDDKFS